MTDRAREYYSSGELQFNEYMTFAVFLMFAADHLSAPAFAELKDDVVSMMVKRRGFPAFEFFADEALDRYGNDEDIAETLIPSLIEWCAAYEARQ